MGKKREPRVSKAKQESKFVRICTTVTRLIHLRQCIFFYLINVRIDSTVTEIMHVIVNKKYL